MNNLTLIRSCTLFGLLLAVASAFAQESAIADTIVFHDGHKFVVQVDEVGLDAIVYNVTNETLRRSVDKSEVARVKLHTGQTLEFTQSRMDAQLSTLAGNKKHVVKIDILSPAANHLVFGYEQVILPWMNVEAKVGIIGVGIAKMGDVTYSGFSLKAGMKFISRPSVVTHGMRLNSLLQGAYVKPELIYISYTANEINGWYPEPVGSGGDFAFNMVLGNQHVLGCVTVDTFFGLGFGTHWIRTEEEVSKEQGEDNLFGVLIGPSSLPIAVSAGITLGVAF